jgi:hypothetical protein
MELRRPRRGFGSNAARAPRLHVSECVKRAAAAQARGPCAGRLSPMRPRSSHPDRWQKLAALAHAASAQIWAQRRHSAPAIAAGLTPSLSRRERTTSTASQDRRSPAEPRRHPSFPSSWRTSSPRRGPAPHPATRHWHRARRIPRKQSQEFESQEREGQRVRRAQANEMGDSVGSRWNVTSGRRLGCGPVRRRPEVAIHLPAKALRKPPPARSPSPRRRN